MLCKVPNDYNVMSAMVFFMHHWGQSQAQFLVQPLSWGTGVLDLSGFVQRVVLFHLTLIYICGVHEDPGSLYQAGIALHIFPLKTHTKSFLHSSNITHFTAVGSKMTPETITKVNNFSIELSMIVHN